MPNMEPMKTFTVGADTWEIVDGAAREELADARTGADGTEYESAGEAMRGSVNGINDDLEANYALQDGYYEMLTAGSADNLTGRGDGVGAEFINRTAGGSADVADGVAKIQSVKGNTLVWNQLIPDGNFEDSTAWAAPNAVNMSVVDNVLTITIADNTISVRPNVRATGNIASPVAGHKLLLRCDVKKNSAVNVNMSVFGQSLLASVTQNDTWATFSKIVTAVSTTYQNLLYVNENVNTFANGDTISYRRYNVIDLTQMFGAGNEPATVAEFEALYPETYYPYDAGSLLNVNMQGVRTVGFNQFDEVWESGLIAQAGSDTADNKYLRAKNYTRVFGGATYHITRGAYAQAVNFFGLAFYDVNKEFISRPNIPALNNVTEADYTVPIGAYYVRPVFGNSGGSAITPEQAPTLCINLSWSGYRNGEYEPYWTQTREIDTAAYFPDGMKSAGSVYDELTATKAVKRVGEMNLAEQTWQWQSTWQAWYTDYNTAIAQGAANTSIPCNVRHAVYSAEAYSTMTNGAMAALNQVGLTWQTAINGCRVVVRNGSETEKPTGTLYYELAEPVETEITPELNLTYKVSDFGTEEILVADGAQTAPVCMQVVYGLNAVDTIRRLPVEYISHKSFMQFISAIESHFNVTITETYDSDNERYNYSIASNATNESGE